MLVLGLAGLHAVSAAPSSSAARDALSAVEDRLIKLRETGTADSEAAAEIDDTLAKLGVARSLTGGDVTRPAVFADALAVVHEVTKYQRRRWG